MASTTILGKRSRSSDEDTIVVSCRAKRRILVSIAEDNKENQDEDDILLYEDLSVAPSQDDTTYTIPTPNTPRHRDSLSKKCPVTPRHRMLVGGKAATPRTPRTPTTPAGFIKSIFNDAKKVFTRSADEGVLIGREKEKAELETFINERVEAKAGGCLYVSGPPGTGKSAFVTQTCRGLQSAQSINHAYINCMSVKSASELYDLMAAELELDEVVVQGHSKTALQKQFGKQGNVVSLVVLDEIDQLLALDSTTLCSFFEWSFEEDSKLILVGIANALDLTDRFLPRLKAKNLRPTLLPFLPYSKSEVGSILTSRARSLLPPNSTAKPDFVPFLSTMAITLISTKVAAQSGDLRKAFDITFRAIELVEQETRDKLLAEQAQPPPSPTRTPLKDNINISSPPSTVSKQTTSLANITFETAPRATPAHINRITAAAISQSNASNRLKTLNLQQKAILCSLVALEARQLKASQNPAASLPSPRDTPTARKLFTTPKKSAAEKAALGAPTLRMLYETYTSLCKRDNVLQALSNTEFRDVIANLETMSLVTAAEGGSASTSRSGAGLFASSLTGSVTPGRSGGRKKNVHVPVDERRVKATVGRKELEEAVEGVGSGVLRGMLNGEGF